MGDFADWVRAAKDHECPFETLTAHRLRCGVERGTAVPQPDTAPAWGLPVIGGDAKWSLDES